MLADFLTVLKLDKAFLGIVLRQDLVVVVIFQC